MGFDCPLTPLFTFIYRADFGDGLIEHELDHVFVGQFDGEPRLNPSEVASYRWQTPADLLEDMEAHPESYTYWFRHIIRRVLKEMAA